jgi:hypothetical protein
MQRKCQDQRPLGTLLLPATFMLQTPDWASFYLYGLIGATRPSKTFMHATILHNARTAMQLIAFDILQQDWVH